MSSDLINEQYNSAWGDMKLGKLWVSTKDLLENGKQPLLPAESFYSNWNNTVKDLSIMASKILKYLKFKSFYVLRVNFSESIESPGEFMINNGKAKITINEKYKNNSSACAAILAHEICHFVLAIRDTTENNIYENERLTDFATVYFGLGVLVLNGKHIFYKTNAFSFIESLLGFLALIFAGVGFISDPRHKVESSFGYWGEKEYYNIFLGYIVRNNLNLDKISNYIKAESKNPSV